MSEQKPDGRKGGGTLSQVADFAELHVRTNFSFLKGASHARELVQTAAKLELRAIAITDENGVYALPKAFYEARQHPGLKLITGCDLLVDGRAFVTLLALSRAGYGRMCRLLTEAHRDGPDARPGLTTHQWVEHLLAPGGQDLLVIFQDPLDQSLPLGHYAQVKDLAPDRSFIFLTHYMDGRDRKRHRLAKEISQKFQMPLVASNDVFYHQRDRKSLQDVLTSTRILTPMEHAGLQLQQNGERYLKTREQMLKLYKDEPLALQRTVEISERCQFQLSELRYQYPSEWIPTGHTADSYLRDLVFKGASERYNGVIPGDVLTQIEHELQLIEQLKFADYFLTIWEIVDFARSRQILCQGRGSAANSVVCYCLGITAVDPVRMNLLFERFLSAERGEPPDIDVDFEHERREEVIQHIYSKYGRDRAGMVCSIITYRTKSALRDVGRAFHLQMDVKDYRARRDQAPTLQGKHPRQVNPNFQTPRLSTEDSQTTPSALASHESSPEQFEKFKTMVEQIKTFPRHLSIHTGGFTISKDPLIETVPIQPARMKDRTIVQWDKEDLEIVGLVKVDVLALGMLTAISKTLRLIGREFYQIPPEDTETYEMIGRCETVGVFQIESRAQMSMLGRLKPKNFYDLVIEVAIVRPGPIMGKMVHPYLRRRRGEEPIDYPHPKLVPILGRTLGVPIFQEQVMKMAIELAGFRPGEADELRRAINAWRSVGDINAVGKRLMEGLLKSGLPRPFVERIFEQIKGFAHYGFPESHAASFALITYASCYLKCHHPLEFTCSLINSQPMGFYAVHTLIEEAKRAQVKVLPVDINHSSWDCTCEESVLSEKDDFRNDLSPSDMRLARSFASSLSRDGKGPRQAELGERPFRKSSFSESTDSSHHAPQDFAVRELGKREFEEDGGTDAALVPTDLKTIDAYKYLAYQTERPTLHTRRYRAPFIQSSHKAGTEQKIFLGSSTSKCAELSGTKPLACSKPNEVHFNSAPHPTAAGVFFEFEDSEGASYPSSAWRGPLPSRECESAKDRAKRMSEGEEVHHNSAPHPTAAGVFFEFEDSEGASSPSSAWRGPLPSRKCETAKDRAKRMSEGEEAPSESSNSKKVKALRLGLKLTLGISKDEVESIVRARDVRPFESLRDFLSRTKIRSHILHRLAMADAFRSLGLDRREALWQILSDQLLVQTGTASQLTLFSYSDKSEDSTKRPTQTEANSRLFKNLTKAEKIENDFEVFKVSIQGHPLAALRDRSFELPPITTQQARQKPRGSIFEIGGLIIVRQRPSTASGTVFATLEDEFGYLDTVLRKDIYERFHDIFDSHSFLIMKGQLQRDGNSVSFVIRSIRPLWPSETLTPQSHDYH